MSAPHPAPGARLQVTHSRCPVCDPPWLGRTLDSGSRSVSCSKAGEGVDAGVQGQVLWLFPCGTWLPSLPSEWWSEWSLRAVPGEGPGPEGEASSHTSRVRVVPLQGQRRSGTRGVLRAQLWVRGRGPESRLCRWHPWEVEFTP